MDAISKQIDVNVTNILFFSNYSLALHFFAESVSGKNCL